MSQQQQQYQESQSQYSTNQSYTSQSSQGIQGLTLGYWNVMGRVEPIRLLLEYTQIPYQMNYYHENNFQQWFFEDKPKLNTPFPNLPYIKDNSEGFETSESEVICLYICNKAGQMALVGETLSERITIGQAKGVSADIKDAILNLAYHPNYCEKLRDETLEMKVSSKMDELESYFLKHEFLNNGKICIADFYLYDCLSWLNRMAPGYFDKKENIKRFISSFQNIPQIKQYLASDRYPKDQLLCGPYATWRG